MKTLFFILCSCVGVLASPPPGYYDSAAGRSGEALRQALNAIIRNHTVMSYANTEAALKVLDEDPADTNNVYLLYAERSEPKSTFGTTDGWNREHLWPNSYGIDNQQPAYSDLFNLRAEDATVNSSRGNKYFDQSDPNDPNFRIPAHDEALGCSSDTYSWFPPSPFRGDIARALLYMDVRYAGTNGEPDLFLTSFVTQIDSASAKMGRLARLLHWHEGDPVDDAERARNEKIFTNYQHNRNPFVDHPEWVEQVFWPRLDWMVQPITNYWPQVRFSWPANHAGARLEWAFTPNGPWHILPGVATLENESWAHYELPQQCSPEPVFEDCVQFYRLNLLP